MPVRSIHSRPAFCRLRWAKRQRPCPFVVDGQKSYRFTVRWGEETDTDDAEGETVQDQRRRPSRGEVEAALWQFTGDIMQVPPAYSAIKVDGARAYDLAREGKEFEIAARPVHIDRLELLDNPRRRPLPCSKRSAARAPICGLWPATWGARSGLFRACQCAAPHPGRAVRRKGHNFAG